MKLLPDSWIVPGNASGKEAFLRNEDLLPVKPSKRTWGKMTYSLFWFAEQASVTSWTVASTGVTLGLSWWEAWLCVILGRIVIAFFMVGTGRPGMVYRIPFPVITRASFGIWGSYWPFFNRDVMTIIWCGVQGVTTGNCIYVMLYSWTPKIAEVHNPFSSDYSITGGRLIGFAIGWVFTLGMAFVPIQKYGYIVIYKTLIMIILLIIFLIWCLVEAHGVGTIMTAKSNVGAGNSHGWVFVGQLFTQAAQSITFATNNADLTRNAKSKNDALWTQIISAPLSATIVALLGILVTSTSEKIFGTIIWDPTKILEGLLVRDYSSKTRCGVFFISLGFTFSQVVTQLFANIISGGNDTAALCPKYINIRRGAVIVMILSFAITPWNLSKSSFSFTSYLTSYQIFLSGILGVVISDYFLVRKGFYLLDHLYTSSDRSIYHYTYGINWRAYVAYFLSWAPVFPGFLHACGNTHIPLAAQRVYVFALPIGIFVAAFFYYVLNYFWPPESGFNTEWNEVEPYFIGDELQIEYLDKEEIKPEIYYQEDESYDNSKIKGGNLIVKEETISV